MRVSAAECVRVQIAPRRKWEANAARATVPLVMCPLVALDLHEIVVPVV